MRAAVVDRGGPPDVIRVVDDWPDPGPPRDDEVLIDVAAAGLNPSDAKIRAAADGRSPRLPYVAGREAAGTVAAVGADVTGLAAGDSVFCFFGWDSRDGGHAERVAVKASAVARRPPSDDVMRSAGIPLAGLTALQALQFLDPPAGERIVVTAGAGGVGHLAVQLAVARGLEVVATAGPANHEFVLGLGAAEAVDYHRPDAADRLARHRYLLDCVGAANIALYLDRLAPDAKVAAVAGLPPALRENPRATAVRCTASAANMAALASLMEAGRLGATVQEAFPLERAADAHRLLEGGHVRGKLVISI